MTTWDMNVLRGDAMPSVFTEISMSLANPEKWLQN